jgi:hypothetical protein
MEKYEKMEMAAGMLQVAIVLASATIITGVAVLAYLSMGIGVVALAFVGAGCSAAFSEGHAGCRQTPASCRRFRFRPRPPQEIRSLQQSFLRPLRRCQPLRNMAGFDSR